MTTPKVYLVLLRRPKRGDQRSDPFYEFGSFGCTGCHAHNLMHPNHACELRDARLAFAQGGPKGFRLVFLTPPIKIKKWATHNEARWTPHDMPFKYDKAPILIVNDKKRRKHGRSSFRLLKKYLRGSRRRTLEGALSSCFRTRTKSINEISNSLAREFIRVYKLFRRKPHHEVIATRYTEALPYTTKTDPHRYKTYRCLIDKLQNKRGQCHTVNKCSPRSRGSASCR